MWRWTGFNMGLDLIITFDDYTISLKRSLTASGNVEHEALLSNHKKRHIFYRVCVVSLNSQKQVVYQANSSIKSLTLSRNQTQCYCFNWIHKKCILLSNFVLFCLIYKNKPPPELGRPVNPMPLTLLPAPGFKKLSTPAWG